MKKSFHPKILVFELLFLLVFSFFLAITSFSQQQNSTDATIKYKIQSIAVSTICKENPSTTWYLDADNDGYYINTIIDSISPGSEWNNVGGIFGDCNDNNASINEAQTWYQDFDNDGHYVSTQQSCTSPGVGWRLDGTTMGDCDDTNPNIWQSSTLYIDNDGDGYDAGQSMVCYDNNIPIGYTQNTFGADCNDNDASAHENQTWYLDADNDGHYVNSIMSCSNPGAGWNTTATMNGDCDDNSPFRWQSAMLYADFDFDGYDAGQEMVCYGDIIPVGYSTTTMGSDCNDNDATVHDANQTWYLDADNDGHYVSSMMSCSNPGAGWNTTATMNGDCDDNSPFRWQSAMLYADFDFDGYDAGQEMVCYGDIIPVGYSTTTMGSDCNDNDATVHDANQTWYLDADNDGHYVSSMMSCSNPGAGWNTTATMNGDCDDNSPFRWQSAMLYADFDFDGYDAGQEMVCYGDIIPVGYSTTTMGSDCNDNDATVWQTASLYIDNDGDGYDAVQSMVCYGNSIPSGYIQNTLGSDCNDNDANVHNSQTTWYLDADNDNYYINTQLACQSPGMGWNTNGGTYGDCNDNDSTITISINVEPITGLDKVCVGSSIQLSCTTAGGTWSIDNTNASINSSGELTGVNAGNVTVTYSIVNGTCSGSSTKTVTVNALPMLSISGNDTVCLGISAYYYGTPSGGTWESSNAAVANMNGDLLETYSSGSITLTYRYTSLEGCETTTTKTIYVQARPATPTVANGGSSWMCAYGSVQLTTTSTGGTWMAPPNTTGVTVNQGGLVVSTTNPTVSTGYAIWYQVGRCSSVPLYVSVMPKPADITGNDTVCIGITNYYYNTTPGGTWSTSDNSIATVTSDGRLMGIAQGSVTLYYTINDPRISCSSQKTIYVQARPATTTVANGGSSWMCAYGSVQLTTTSTGGTWMAPPNTTGVTVNQGGLVVSTTNPTVSTGYAIWYQVGRCSSVPLYVSVMPKPADITGNDTVCIGITNYYYNTTPGGTWSTSDNSIATVTSDGRLMGIAQGSVTLYYTINDPRISCSSQKTIYVQARPATPTVANGGSSWMCAYGSVQLTTTSTGGTWMAPPNTTGVSVNQGGLVVSTTNPTVSTGYAIWYQVGRCSSVPLYVSVMPKPADITGANNVCKDGTIQLANTTAGGTWTSSNNSIATVDNTGVVTGIAAGTVTIYYTINDPRISCSSSKQITVDNGINVAPIQGNLRPCAPGTTTLTCATPNGVWSCASSNASINSSGTLTITGVGPIRVFYTVFDNSGCTGYATANIIANGKPTVAAIQGPTSVCLPGTAQYTCATPGGVWSSSNISIVGTINQNGLFTTSERAGTTRIEYAVTNANGCSDTARLWIAIKYSSSSTTNVTICSTDAPYTWNGNNYDSTGIYTVHLTNANGCDSAATLNLTVNKAVTPLVKILASSDTGCWSKTITFTAQVTNGGPTPTFQWFRNGLAVGGNSQTYTDSYIWSGTRYSVFMNANNTCQTNAHTSDHLEMYLDSGLKPSVSIIASANPICSDSLTTITATTVNGGPSPIYKWFLNGNEFGGNVSSFTTTSLNNTDRIMCIIFANNACQTLGSTSSNQIVMQVMAKPTVAAIQGDNAPCVGTSTTLTCATPNGVWSCNGTNAVIFQSGNLYINGPGSFTVYYTVTNPNGCSSYSSFIVVPKTLPTVAAIQGNATPCVGSTTTLTCTTAGGVWSCNGTNAAINQNGELTVTGTGSFTVYYTITGANGCVNKSLLIIVPNAKPNVAAITGATSFCVGKTTTYTNATTGGVWSSSSATIATINSAGVLTGIAAGTTTIRYTVTNAQGCSAYQSINCAITSVSIPAITGATSVCVGSNITLSNSQSGGVWSSLNNKATVNSSGVVIGANAGTATIQYAYTNANGCVATATYNVTVNAIPAIPGIGYAAGTTNPQTGAGGGFCLGRTFTVVGSPSGGVWSATGGITITSGGVATTASLGAASLKYTVTSNGCSNSRTITGNVVNCTAARGSIATVTKPNFDFELYPNPARNFITINTNQQVSNGKIVITDIYGKQLKTFNLNIETNQIDVSNLSVGAYFVSVITKEQTITKRLLVE